MNVFREAQHCSSVHCGECLEKLGWFGRPEWSYQYCISYHVGLPSSAQPTVLGLPRRDQNEGEYRHKLVVPASLA